MKPAEHPEFFERPAPFGRSRESDISLDENGNFWHQGEKIERPTMRAAFFRWLRRHPTNGRFILENGYDWTYIDVQGTPFFVEAVRVLSDRIRLELCDGTEEDLDPSSVMLGPDGVVRCKVKQGAYEARFQAHAQLDLSPALSMTSEGNTVLRVGETSLSLAEASLTER